jgi:hypothetical protein
VPERVYSSLAISLDIALEHVASALLELANRVHALFAQSDGNIDVFCMEIAWENRTTLERRIINFLCLPQRDGYFTDEDRAINELSLHLGIPLPLVAQAVYRMRGGQMDPVRPTPDKAPALEMTPRVPVYAHVG